MVDAYDVLSLNLDAGPEEIKKAYRRLSLQLHPDKVQAGAAPVSRDGLTPEERFNELKVAYDVLQDAERRSVYDTFGVDLGASVPSQEVWSIGMTALVAPMSTFTAKTFVACGARWLASFFAVKLAVLLCLVSGTILHARGLGTEIGGVEIVQKPVRALINVAAMCCLLLVHSLWPVLFDVACFVYLVTEVVGVEVLAQSGQLVGIVVFGCLVLAWLASRWWSWILGLELTLLGIALLSSGVAAAILRLFVEQTKMQHADKVRDARQSLRKERQRLTNEVERLKRQLEAQRSRKPR